MKNHLLACAPFVPDGYEEKVCRTCGFTHTCLPAFQIEEDTRHIDVENVFVNMFENMFVGNQCYDCSQDELAKLTKFSKLSMDTFVGTNTVPTWRDFPGVQYYGMTTSNEVTTVQDL